MKKLLITFIFIVSSFNYLKADDVPPEPCIDPITGEESDCDGAGDTGGTGGVKVPIDDYLPALVVLGITLGGVVVYKNRKRLS